jgi:hypothetical protein
LTLCIYLTAQVTGHTIEKHLYKLYNLSRHHFSLCVSRQASIDTRSEFMSERYPENHAENEPGGEIAASDQIEPTAASSQIPPSAAAGSGATPAQQPFSYPGGPATCAPSESFGSFDMPASPSQSDPYALPQSASSAYSPYPAAPVPGYPPAPGSAPAPMPGYGYPPAPAYGYPPMPVQPAPAAVSPKKPIYFPLTRGASALMQIFDMLVYSLLAAICVMLIPLYLLKSYENNFSVYSNADGSVNGLSILLTFVLVLLIVPACSLLCGAFFGSWRGLLVSLLSIGGGLLLGHLSDDRLWNFSAFQTYLGLAPLPVAALIVGLFYDHRKYAAWWKSMLTMLLGSSIIVIWLYILLFVFVANNIALLNTTTTMTSQQLLAGVGILYGCLAIFLILLWTFLIAGIEGLVHNRIAAVKNK